MSNAGLEGSPRTLLDKVWAGGDCAAVGDDLTVTAVAQGRDSAAGFQFPASPASWVNSRPFTREQLDGKVAVMVFFEEG